MPGISSLDQLKVLGEDPSIKVSTAPSWKNFQFLINTQKYPTKHPAFRQALQYLWDYESVTKDILHGYGTVPKGPLPTSMWGHASVPMATYDLDKARQLLEASGVPKQDWKVSMQYISGVYSHAAELFQATASQVGVEVELRPGEWGVIWDKARSWIPLPTCNPWLGGRRIRHPAIGFSVSSIPRKPRYSICLTTATQALIS